MLHKYGDTHPESGLHNKVKGWQFSQKIKIMDPVTKKFDNKPMKPFMVNQLTICIERGNLILSPFDELLHKQLVDYEVKGIRANGDPIYTDVNEHFVDALGLAFLAFVLEFPNITNTVQDVNFTAASISTDSPLTNKIASYASSSTLSSMRSNVWSGLRNGSISYEDSLDPRERDKPKYFQTSGAGFAISTRKWNSSRMAGRATRRNF